MEEAKSKKRFSSGFSIDSLLENKKEKRSGHDEDIEFHRQISSVEGFQKVHRSLSDSELSENSKAFSLAESELFRQRIVEKKLYEDFIKQKPDVYPTETALLRPSQPTIMRESSILRAAESSLLRPTKSSLLRPLEPSLLRPSAEPSLLRPCSYSPPSQHSPTYKDIIPSPPWKSEYDSLPERLSPYREKTSYPRNSIFYNPLHKNRHSAFAVPLSREFPPYRKGLPFVYPGMSFYASKHDFMAYHHHHADMHADPKKCGQVRFSHSQSTELERVFLVQKYISPHERKQIARSLELSERQVKTWFQNRRAKWRRLKIEDEMRTRITGEVVKSDTQF